MLNKANGRIAYRFHARDLHLVMGPCSGEMRCDFACSSMEAAWRRTRNRHRRAR